MVMPVQSDVGLKLDREVRRKEELIQDYQRQLGEARGQVVPGHPLPPDPQGTLTGDRDRLQAAHIGA